MKSCRTLSVLRPAIINPPQPQPRLRQKTRSYSKSSAAEKTPFTAKTLSSHSARIGRCLAFGLQTPTQYALAASLCNILATEWRDLIAGGEGFLTAKNRRGLWRQQVVWGEQDIMGHVNNVVYNKYAESARVNWAANYAHSIDPTRAKEWMELISARGSGLILRSMRTDFKFPMKYPDRVTVFHKLALVPDPSADAFLLDVMILSEAHRRPAARCAEDIVLYDYRKEAKVKLEKLPWLLDAFQDTYTLQQQMQDRMIARAAEIETNIRELEKSSWDREGAVEDFGSAAPS